MASIAEKIVELEREKNSLQDEFDEEVKQLEVKFNSRKEDLDKKRQTLIDAAEILGEPITLQSPNENGNQNYDAEKLKEGLSPYPISIGDSVEIVLREKGKPMPIADLMKEAAKMGVTPSGNTFRSAIRKDYRQRFEKVGFGIYTLRKENAT